MTRTTYLFVLVILIIAPFAAKGQGKFLGEADDTKRHAEQIVDLLTKADYEKLERFTTMIWHGTAAELQMLHQTLKQRMPQFTAAYGSVIERDYIGVQKVGNTLLRHVLLIRFERQPVRARVTYYKSVKGWILLDLALDAGASKILDEDGVEQKTPPQLPVPMLPGMGMPGK